MGSHVKRNGNGTFESTPAGRASGWAAKDTIPWPARPSGSTSQARPANVHSMGRQGTQAVLVPDFVSKSYLPEKYGYQEVHKMYNEMRNFFAKRASAYQNEVATIKVTLMSMKPNNWTPQMVMVSKNITRKFDAE